MMAEIVLMPKLGLTMTEGIVNEWFKNEGDSVKKGEVICSISSEKLSNDVEAESDGLLLKIVVPAGSSTACTTPIAYIGKAGEDISHPDSALASVASESTDKQPKEQSDSSIESISRADSVPDTANKSIFISKLAKKIATDKGIDYSLLTGTGGNGRITRRDVEKYLATVSTKSSKVALLAGSKAAGTGLTGMRKVIAQNMMHSIHSTAQLTLQRKIDITALMELRVELKQKLGDIAESNTFSINIFVLKAVALALQDVPALNSHYDGNTYQQISDINIGVAVSLQEGLVVPVIGDVARKSLTQIAQEFHQLVSNAREGKFSSSVKGTFTITNLGAEGIEYFTPILNTPEVGIVGIGALNDRLYLNGEGALQTAKDLPLSLTFDHQVIDGALAAQFLSVLASYLSNPYRLLI